MNKINIIILIIFLIFNSAFIGCIDNDIDSLDDSNNKNNIEAYKPDIIDLKVVDFEKQGYFPQLYVIGLIENIAKVIISNVTVIIKLLDEKENIISTEIVNIKPYLLEPGEYGILLFRKSVELHDSIIVEINSYFTTNKTKNDNITFENLNINEKSNQFFSIEGLIKNKGNYSIFNITVFVVAYDNNSKLLDIGGSSTIQELKNGDKNYFKSKITIYDKWYNVTDIISYKLIISYD